MTNNINNDKIRQLSQREQARDKISVWYGSADNYEHGLREVMANATDEITNNFEKGDIYVELSSDNKTITVRDSGRGIPISGESDGKKNYELLFLQFFAGSKYGNDGITNGAMTGTNGSGLVALNYTSLLFEVTSVSNGKKHHIKFENGGHISEELSTTNKEEIHGSTFKFKLDPEVYTETEFTSEQVKGIVSKYAVSSSKITIHYRYMDEKTTFHYDSIKDYFDEIVGDGVTSGIKHSIISDFVEEDGEKTSIEIVYATTVEPRQESFLNLTYLPDGGSINNGIINGFKLYMNKYCRDNGLFPKGLKSFNDSDIEDSISFVSIVFSNRVEFQNQTKFSTAKKLYFDVAKKKIQESLEIMEIEDVSGFKRMVDHILLIQKDNASNQKQKEKLKKQLTEKVDMLTNRIEKFVDCRAKGEEAELYLAEGDSAHGSIVLARDGKFQASLPMGGKFLNVSKARNIDAIVNNETIMNVVKVLGCGIDLGRKQKDLPKFNINNLKYGKVICAVDSDPDGKNILALMITLFYNLMPEIIKQGSLYYAKTPLYEIKLKNDSVIYVYTDEERDSVLKKYKKEVSLVMRNKGLGEMDAKVLSETAMNPKTRHLVRISMGDAIEAQRTIDDWMGVEVDNRKEFISENLNKFLSIVSEE